MTPNESESHPPVHPEPKSYSTRRDFLLQIGIVLNAVAGFMIGIPVVGFILSSIIKKTPQRIIAEATDWRFLNEQKARAYGLSKLLR